MFDILTIGSATRDIFLFSKDFVAFPSAQFSTGIGECVALGSKVEISKFVATTGGGATNTAATFASLGFKTAIIAHIGDDAAGRDVIEDLQRFSVKTNAVQKIKHGQTGYSTLLTMEDGERTVLVYRGVSSSFTTKNIDWSLVQKTRWLYLTSLGGNVALTKRLIFFAHKRGVRIAWNPGQKEIEHGLHALKSLLQKTDVLLLNLEEAKKLTGKDDMREILKDLRIDGKIRVITNGPEGATALSHEHITHAATTGAKAISRTGAGDAFGSGFVAGFIKTQDIHSALAIGTANAESVIQHIGAKQGILKKWPSKSQINKISLSSV